MTAEEDPPRQGTLSRRTFVRGLMVAGAVTGASLPLLLRFARRSAERTSASATPPVRRLDPARFAALAAIQDRLLPSEPGAPGARDIGATAYLEGALADPRTERGDVATVDKGLAELEQRARARHGRAFAEVGPAEQEALLGDLQKDEAGAEWIGVMVVFTLEALLGDPVYGGNRDEQGWRWLGLTPPGPRPPRRWNARTV